MLPITIQLAILAALASPAGSTYASGPATHYAPRDGFNAGQLACGGTFKAHQDHIAIRDWKAVGCGRRVLVYSESTKRWATTTVRDAGPYGIVTGPVKNAYREGRWKVWAKVRNKRLVPPPTGWRYRGKVDLSIALWRRLGRPRALSVVRMWFLAGKR